MEGSSALVVPSGVGTQYTNGSRCDAGQAALSICVIVKLTLPENGLSGLLSTGSLSSPTLCELNHLQDLNLEGNQLNGALPQSSDCFQRLRWLNIERNRLTGPLPPWVLRAPLETLAIKSNSFEYPNYELVRELRERCRSSMTCSGIPGGVDSTCSAFGTNDGRYKLDGLGTSCTLCPSTTRLLINGIVIPVPFILLFFVFVHRVNVFIKHHREYHRRYVSSFIIIVSHTQTLALIGSMRLGWPRWMTTVRPRRAAHMAQARCNLPKVSRALVHQHANSACDHRAWLMCAMLPACRSWR